MRIITVCGDPGGANALAPVLKLLKKKEGVHLIHYAYNEALDVLKRHHIEARALPAIVDENFVKEAFQENQATLLFTATSVNSKNWEQLFIKLAERLSIYSIALLDFWSNYAARFICLPQRIAVMDERAKAEMIQVGIPADKIIVTGQPAFDALVDCREQFSSTKRQAIRRALKVQDHDLLVLFASQPLRKLYGEPKDAIYLGYDEQSTLQSIIHALEGISQKHNRAITLLIRPHPRETLAEYKAYQSHKINIMVDREGSSDEHAMAADLVLGMTSVLLVEACYLHCIVLSLQLGLRQPDVLPTNKWGASVAINCEEDVAPTLEKYLFNHKARQALLDKALSAPPSAARHIVDAILTLRESLN